jgi:hypothetical protein
MKLVANGDSKADGQTLAHRRYTVALRVEAVVHAVCRTLFPIFPY